MAIPPFGTPPTPDATSSKKGKVQLTGDLGNTAASPQVVNLHLSGDTAINHKLTSVTDPTAAQDAATKNYVDTRATSSSFVSNEVPGGTINGSNTAFTTASNYATGSLRVYRNGIRLKHGGVDFTENGTNSFTMTTAPNTGDLLLVDYNVSATGFSVGTNSTISSEAPSGTIDGSNTTYTLSRAYIAGSLEVYIDGVHQRRTTDYTETTPGSGIFTMATAPLSGQTVYCNYQFNLNPSSNADTVDGIHASSTATANQLMPLDGNAKVNSTLLYNPYKFFVYRSTAYTTVNAVATAMPFDTRLFDTGSNVDITTNKGRFTAPVAGYYAFTGTILLNAAIARVFVSIYKNGVSYKRGVDAAPGSGGVYSAEVNGLVQLAAGDYVEMYYFVAAAQSVATQTDTSLSGFLVSTL